MFTRRRFLPVDRLIDSVLRQQRGDDSRLGSDPASQLLRTCVMRHERVTLSGRGLTTQSLNSPWRYAGGSILQVTQHFGVFGGRLKVGRVRIRLERSFDEGREMVA